MAGLGIADSRTRRATATAAVSGAQPLRVSSLTRAEPPRKSSTRSFAWNMLGGRRFSPSLAVDCLTLGPEGALKSERHNQTRGLQLICLGWRGRVLAGKSNESDS
jgi:hypothetical protein